MIRQIDTSEAVAQPAPTQVPPATPAGKTFASVLAQKKDAGATGRSPKSEKIDAPEGEIWTPIPGHKNAAKISDGPREGLYINLSHGERRGETFTIEKRDGKTVHVYGSGADQKVIEAARDEDEGARKINGKRVNNGAKAPKGEEWAPVAGHNHYADIVSGKRNGLYVNISGGVRDGMTFQIVKHGDRTFHVYGSGKHRQVIEVGAHKKKAEGSAGGAPAAGSSSE